MYFAQEYISLGPAVALSAAVAIAIIGVRAVTVMPVWLAVAGIVLPAAVIMSVTLVAAIYKPLQGILLTGEALGVFITAMMLMPKVNATSRGFWGIGAIAAAAPAPSQSGDTASTEDSQVEQSSADP